MKRIIYLISFTVFGILLQLLIHAAIEIWYINRLVADFPKYSFGLSWAQLFLFHHIATVILLLAGAAFGFWCGKFFWHKIYGRKN